VALSHEIISQFAKLVNSDKKQTTESTIYGTVVDQQGHKPGDKDKDGNEIVIDESGGKYIKPDGSDQLIPITDTDVDPKEANAMINTNYGDRASVLIKNHTATVTGNISSPAAGNKDIEKQITQFDIAVGEQIQADKAYFKDLTADKANLGSLAAAIVSVAELIAKDAEIGKLVTKKATITDLVATKIDADVVIADEAIIEHLKAGTIDVLSLIADTAAIKKLMAEDASITFLDALNANLKYANIDFANIGEAAITKLFTDSGIINDLIVKEGKITGELVGVTIKGDLIEAGTLKADRLVVKGSDGNYYALNTDFTAMPGVTPVEEDSIHGSVLVKKSIVAEKIAVTDLVAFGATIGGFKIGDHSIYSGVKNSVDNTTRGLYMDDKGQLALGDDSNYIKYAKDENGNYKLSISTVDKMVIGGRNLIKKSDTEQTTDGSSSILQYDLSEPMIAGEKYTMSLCCSPATDIDYINMQAFNISEVLCTFRPVKCNNILPYPYKGKRYNTDISTDVSFTQSGVTFTDNGDGSITVNGTNTSASRVEFYISDGDSDPKIVPDFKAGVTYIISDGENYADGKPTSGDILFRYYDSSGTRQYITKINQPFTWGEGWTLQNITLAVDAGDTVENRTYRPMINAGSTVLPYEKYVASTGESGKQTLTNTFTLPAETPVDELSHANIELYVYPESESATIHWTKLERGDKVTDWTPAPEDMATNDELNEQISALSVTTDAINASVTSLTASTNDKIDNVNDNIDNINKDIKELYNEVALSITDEKLQIEIENAIKNGSSKVVTKTGFVFDDDGMTVDKKDETGKSISPTNTKITENGMTVNNNATGDPVLTANKDGVDAENLNATTYLIVGGRSRFENYTDIDGNKRTACFWIGE